jgi:hypothetical protein
MWLNGKKMKQIICFLLETAMLVFVCAHSWILAAPESESKPPFEAASIQQPVLRNASDSHEFPHQDLSKVPVAINDFFDLTLDFPSNAIAASDDAGVNTSVRKNLYAYTTINAP